MTIGPRPDSMRRSAPATRRRHGAGRLVRRSLPPIASIGALLAVWEAAVRLGGISERTLAAPSQIVASMIDTWPDLMSAAAMTVYETAIGFVIAVAAGVGIGVLLYSSTVLHRALYPLLTAAQTIPLIAIAPLFMLWFGFDPTGKIVLVAVLGLFPVAVQTTRGLQAVPRFYEDVALTCGANRSWTLWHVKLRVAARQIFGGIRICAAYVFGTAVTAEYLGATSGLGIWLQGAFNSFRTPPIFSATIVIIAGTGVLFALIALAEYLLLGPASEDALDEEEGQ
jgi:ABC-type nitrate/sulfonate/bicarbonate transport system permease component